MTKKIFVVLAISLLVHISFINTKAEEVIPEDLVVIANECEEEFNVDKYLLLSLVYEECRFDEEFVDGNITQITRIKWFAEGIEAVGSINPKTDCRENCRICCYYLSKWMGEGAKAEGDPILACRMWNEGYENALENPSLITGYSKRIVNRADEWEEEMLLGGHG